MSLQEIQYSHLDSAKEMFAESIFYILFYLYFYALQLLLAGLRALLRYRWGVFHKQCPQLWSNWGPWPHWRYARGLYGVFGKLEEA